MDPFEKKGSAEKNGASEVEKNGESDDLLPPPPPPPIPRSVAPIKGDVEPVEKEPPVPMARRGQKIQQPTNHFKVDVKSVNGPKDKSGNEVAADGALYFANLLGMEGKKKAGEFQKQGNPYLDGAALWSYAKADLEAMYKATSEAMEGKKKAGEFQDLQTLGPVTRSLFAVFDNESEELRLVKYRLAEMELEFALDFVRTMIEAKRKAMMYGPKDKSGNEVAADGAQSHEEGALRSPSLEGPYRDSPGSTSAQADNNEKVEKTLFERIGPHVRTTMFIAGAFAVGYFFSQNDVHVKMSNEKANEVNQKTITSSSYFNLNFSIKFGNGNFSINFGNGNFSINFGNGTSVGQECRKAG